MTNLVADRSLGCSWTLNDWNSTAFNLILLIYCNQRGKQRTAFARCRIKISLKFDNLGVGGSKTGSLRGLLQPKCSHDRPSESRRRRVGGLGLLWGKLPDHQPAAVSSVGCQKLSWELAEWECLGNAWEMPETARVSIIMFSVGDSRGERVCVSDQPWPICAPEAVARFCLCGILQRRVVEATQSFQVMVVQLTR